MSRTRYRFSGKRQPHFLTSTIVGWLPVFTRREAVQILLDSWMYLQQHQRLTLFAYVVLENHVHWIAASDDLSKEVGDFKSYTARRIIDLLESAGAKMLLDLLAYFKLKHKIDQDYQLWQEGSHPEAIESHEMMVQKLGYIHNNPLKRGYVDEPVHWRYSSARNYARQQGLIEVCTDW
ncbi:MAG: transposase [Planctomycetaceae bacterium]|nr:transposase [Planctomycetaceae bacterium]